MGKYIPSISYWINIVVFILLFIFPIEMFKNKQIQYFQEEFSNNVKLKLKDNLDYYKELANLIYLNDLKVHEDLLNIKKEKLNKENSQLNKLDYQINPTLNLLSFIYIEDIKGSKNLVRINFNLNNFYDKLNEKAPFRFKKVKDYPGYMNTLDIKSIDGKYFFFKNRNINFIGLKKEFLGEKFIVYKNIQNTHLEGISKNFLIIYIAIVFIIISVFTLIYNLNKFRKNYKYYNVKYKELIEGIDKHILMIKVDLDDNITFVTDAFCKWSAYSKTELIGENFEKLIHEDVSENFHKRIKMNLDKGNYWEGELKNKDKYGNSLWSKGVFSPIVDENDKIVEYSFILVDISDNRQMNKINTLLKEELSNKLNEIKIKEDDYKDRTKIQLMSRILDSISHQWKEPISNISIDLTKFSVYLIEHSLHNSDLGKIHNNIDNELKNLSKTLNSFKSLFIKDGSSDKYNVYAVIKDAIEICKNDIKYHDIKVHLDSKKDIYCFGVANEIRYILISLLKHSLENSKHSNNNKNTEITFTVVNDNEDVLIKYSDSTQNFSTEVISEIFENSNDDSVSKDLDANLHIVKLLIEKTASKIWFENSDNQTVFYLKLVSKERRFRGRKS